MPVASLADRTSPRIEVERADQLHPVEANVFLQLELVEDAAVDGNHVPLGGFEYAAAATGRHSLTRRQSLHRALETNFQ